MGQEGAVSAASSSHAFLIKRGAPGCAYAEQDLGRTMAGTRPASMQQLAHRLFERPDAGHEVAEQAARYLGVCVKDLVEGEGRDGHGLCAVGARRDGRRSWRSVEEGHLAEIVTFAEGCTGHVVDGYLGFTLQHNLEPGVLVTLLHHDSSRLMPHCACALDQLI